MKLLQGISQIGVVTGHLRSSGTKKGFDEQRSEHILSLLNSAALSLKALPDMTAADKIVSDIVQAAHELVRSASLHPLGDTLLVSSDTGVCLYSLRLGALHLLKELPLRAVSVVRFSGSGGLWAAAGNALPYSYPSGGR